ncbi:MAG: hypothetical protein IPG58_16090 [Acidobacteria bacterium]|nr:hypothetical protein [Acidobacteriota bacterium]
MRRIINTSILSAVILALTSISAIAQQDRTVITGSAPDLWHRANTRPFPRTFTLNINGLTSAEDAQRYLSILQSGGQDDLLKASGKNDLGYFSLRGSLGRRLNAVVAGQTEDGKIRIRGI